MATIEANPPLFSSSIFTANPKELTDYLDQLGIVKLVQEGYRLVGTDEQILAWTEEEFSQQLNNPVVLYSMHPDRHDQVGAFLILGRPEYIGRKGLEIGGIIIAKDHPCRGSGGAADALMKKAVDLYDPHFVIGATCNIKAMLLRNRVLSPLGYGSMAGSLQFSPVWSRQMVQEAEAIEELYVREHKGRRHNEVIVDVSPEYLEPIHESMRGEFPYPYDDIQRQLFHHQEELGKSGTASIILLSIKEPERLQM